MERFSKRLSNLIFWIVTLLGLSYLFQEQIKNIGIEIILVIAAVILFIGLTYLIILKITEFERAIEGIEQKFIRQKELENIREELNLLKNKK